MELNDFLIKSNSNNYFIINSDLDIDINSLKKIALSNNKLIVIKDANSEINPIYETLANKVIIK